MNSAPQMPPQEPTEEKTPTPAEELQRKMDELRARVEAARVKKEMGKEVLPETPLETTEEKVAELEANYSEGAKLEAEKGELAASIEKTKSELEKFEELLKQAEELGLPVENDDAFSMAYQAEKDKLAVLEQRQNELMTRAKEIANDPKVMEKVQEKAQGEYAEHQRVSEEKQKELEALLFEAKRDIRLSAVEAIRKKYDSIQGNYNFKQKYKWTQDMRFGNKDYQDFIRRLDLSITNAFGSSNSLEDFKQNIENNDFGDVIGEIMSAASENIDANRYFELKSSKA